MSDHSMHDNNPSEDQQARRKEMSRRQFLSYTLGGTGGFMAAVPLIPMIRFTVDPLLQGRGESNWVRVMDADRVTETPVEVSFEVHQVDGWVEKEAALAAWIYRLADGTIVALSPVCKHLGCTVTWALRNPNEFFCPCHDARYAKNGRNLAVAPLPLDQYEVRIDNGGVYLGQIIRNQIVT